MKVSEHIQLVNVDLYRDLFTKHGVHMNKRVEKWLQKKK